MGGSDQVRRGFTLIQISLLLIAASLVLVAVLPSTRTALSGNNDSTVKMNSILTALRGYEATKAALPCPADASQPIGSTSYGLAAANPGTTTNCTGGSPAANYVDATNHVAVGMVPVRALGLSNDYALDAFGRDISYAVDTNATVCFSGSLPGQITVTDNGTANTTIAALVSHGGDGHGAWVPLTGSSGTAVRLNAGSTDADQLTNAHLNSSFTPVTPLTNFVKKMPTTTFDDLVIYKSTLWTLNKVPNASSVLLPNITPPANGNYFTGQTLTFLVTYGSAATVTGTPQLSFIAPQLNASPVTRTANYASGSGTTVLTFTYTVVAADYTPSTPSGVSMSSPIGLNGGSITVAGAAACLTFTPPSLSSVLLNPPIIYVPDNANGRVQWFSPASYAYMGQMSNSTLVSNGISSVAADMSGHLWTYDGDWIYEFNQSGTLLNSIDTDCAGSVALDASGNVWQTMGCDECVAEYSPTATGQNGQNGPWTQRIGPPGGPYNYCVPGTGIGEFNGLAGLAFDPSGNVWVADKANNRLQRFSSGGAYQMTLGGGSSCTSCASTTSCACSSGTGNGLFNSPRSVAVDIAGNIFVSDEGNAQIQVFNSSGTFQRQFGSQGGANGQFGGNWDGPEGLAIDPSGNLWVADGADNRVEEFNGCGQYINSIGAGYNGVSGAQGSNGSGNGQFGSNGEPDPWQIYITPKTPGNAGTCIVSVTPPTSGIYNTGQTLTFTVTYNTAVTVTGTPQLVLTMGSNTRYASYVSGSGSTTLTFTYTIQASDSATSIATTSSINLNGGTITTVSNGFAANNSYTPLSVPGIIINLTSFMLVADQFNNRVQKLTLTGGFVDQLGCASGACTAASTNGQFNDPEDVAVDGSGNIWVTDTNNNRVQKFNSSGVYQNQLGCATGGCPGSSSSGQFNVPFGIAIDGSGDIWVVDTNNNRVQEFSSSGTYMNQVGNGTAGVCAPNELKFPQYVKFDSSGNVYVSDSECGAVQEFTSGGTYIKTIGQPIAGYGNLSNDTDDIAFDACGEMWVQDEGNNHFVELDYEGNFIQNVAMPGTGEQALAIDSTGKIYDLDESSDDIIHLFNSSGTYLSDIGAGPGGGNAQFNGALGMTIVGSPVTRLAISSCPAVITAAAGPTSGNYTTGGTLGFAVTYDQAVTVTGTPHLPITIGTNTTYATYISGSGTSTLTFQYTVLLTDYAASGGVTMNVPIALNGGTITTTASSKAAGLYYQPPTLTGVSVGTLTQIFLTAGTTSWVVPANWDSAVNTIEAIGCGGNGSQGSATTGGAGGGGGEYRKATNVTGLSGTITVSIAAGGAASNTTFNSTTVVAHCGGNAVTTTAGAAGSGGTGATHNNGAAGATDGGAAQGGGGGGGGAGGPSGVGTAGHAGANTEGGGGGGGGSNGGGASTAGTATHGKGGNSGNGSGGGGQTGSAGTATASTPTSAGPAGTAGSGAGGAGSGGDGGTGVASTTGAGGAGAIDAAWNSTHGVGGGGGGSGGSLHSTAGAGGAGGTFGGGGGGSGASGSGASGAGGAGGAGLIIITYGAR
jgi:sugar lactone lactonase YvrE